MKNTYKMELWDMMQSFFKDYNDHMMHAAYYFDGKMDVEALKKAVEATFKYVPVITCRFITNSYRGYWEQLDSYNINEIVTFKESKNLEDVEKFICDIIDETKGPQIKMQVIRVDGKDTLAVLFNHMVCDGAGFKKYIQMLSQFYTGYLNDKNFTPQFTVSQERSFKHFFKSFTVKEQLKLLGMGEYGQPNDKKKGFPFENVDTNTLPSRVVKHKISAETFAQMKAWGKANNATINDIIVACYIRALTDKIGKHAMEVDCIVDLRRYLKDKEVIGFTNFVSKMICSIGEDIGADIKETVVKVHNNLEDAKNNYPGCSGLSKLRLGYSLFTYAIAKKVVRKRYNNPLVAISNIGIIPESDYVFGKLKIADAYMTGSIKRNPFIQLALTTFHNEITMTFAIYGTENDCIVAKEVLQAIDSYANQIK
ncbi:MAG: WS/DGAT domain-containing protein [Clostridia bacterium]